MDSGRMGRGAPHGSVAVIESREKVNQIGLLRPLFAHLSHSPGRLSCRETKQVHDRVLACRKRWPLWAAALLCVAMHAHADRPLYVLSPTLPAGTPILTGGDFVSAGAGTHTVQTTLQGGAEQFINVTDNTLGIDINEGKAMCGYYPNLPAAYCEPVPGTGYYVARYRGLDGQYALTSPLQPSYYSTLTKGEADCSITAKENKLVLGLGYSILVHSSVPDETGPSSTLNLVWALRSTGYATQAPRQYSQTVTSSIVSSEGFYYA